MLFRLTLAALLLGTLGAGPLIGCGDDSEQAGKDLDAAARAAEPDPTLQTLTRQRARKGDLSRGSLSVTAFDLNNDKKEDQWILSEQGRTVRIERDLNFDSRIDQWQYPNAAGDIVEEEVDLDLDGKIDVVIFYNKGVVSRKNMALDFTGNFGISKYYDNQGNLLRVERDEDADGQPDVWEYYQDGSRVRIGWDENKDGVPDRFDTLE